MKGKVIVTILSFLILTGCSSNCCHNDRQIDYWKDNQCIFSRKNYVGSTGKWVDYNSGKDGYFCTNPSCTTTERVQSTGTCTPP